MIRCGLCGSERSEVDLAYSLRREEVEAVCSELGQPSYRARQIWDWLYQKRVTAWSEMRNLPGALRDALAARLSLEPLRVSARETAPDGAARLVVELGDGRCVEQVLIPAGRRRTVCVSSQVGCRYGCVFCASGQAGFVRNLEAGEIVGQVLNAARLWGDRPTHVVFMGMGEPFDNYEQVLRAVRIINDPDGLRIGARRVTLSTCGLIPGIRKLAAEGLQVELSISLHAADDTVRSELMPVNRRYGIDALLVGCREYTERTGRIITFEYTLVKDRNDSNTDAEALVQRLARLQCRVNLIPLSPVQEYAGRRATPAAARHFAKILADAGINATLRHSKGADVQAACGQLRLRSGLRPQPKSEVGSRKSEVENSPK